MRKGQGAVMDALILMMICSAAATLLIYVSGLYGSSSNEQMVTVYNYEYMNIALLSFRFVNDAAENPFWDTLKKNLAESNPALRRQTMIDYFNGDAQEIFDKLDKSASGVVILNFRTTSDQISCFVDLNDEIFCNANDPENIMTNPATNEKMYFEEYSSSARIKDYEGNYWDVSIRIFF